MEIKVDVVNGLLAKASVLRFYGGINFSTREAFAAYERCLGILEVLDALFGREWVDNTRSKLRASYVDQAMQKMPPEKIEDDFKRDNVLLADFFMTLSDVIKKGSDGHSLAEVVMAKRAKGE